MTSVQKTALLDACRVLFPSAIITSSFLDYIQQDGLKNAYRNRAWEHHPDSVESAGDSEQFRRTVDAYKLLDSYIKTRKAPLPTLRSPKKRPIFLKPTDQLQTREKSPFETYYEGDLPTFELKTGLFLYYSGAVSYESVVKALVWRREMRPPIGDFGRQWGWLSERDISLVLRATEIVGTFGERAVELGLLSQSQLNLLLLQQRAMQKPIGKYFTGNYLITEYMLRRHLKDLAKHNEDARASRQNEQSKTIITPP